MMKTNKLINPRDIRFFSKSIAMFKPGYEARLFKRTMLVFHGKTPIKGVTYSVFLPLYRK